MGATRGPTRALIALAVRLGSLLAAFYGARTCAPFVAHWLVTPLVGDLFEARVAALPEILSGSAETLQTAITETAVEMAEGVSFLILLLLFSAGIGMICHLVGDTFRLIGRLPPFGFVGRLAGMGIGLVGGILLVLLAFWLIGVFRPDLYGDLGYLSPAAIQNTTLVKMLLEFFPVAP